MGKKNITLKPEANAIIDQARNILGSPNRVTKRVSNADSSVLGQNQDTGISINDPSSMPDASDYEDGTLVEDDNGNKFKAMNGEWIAQ